jgi:hypothetical protein
METSKRMQRNISISDFNNQRRIFNITNFLTNAGYFRKIRQLFFMRFIVNVF